MSVSQSRVTYDADELLARCMGNLQFAERILAIFQTRFEEDLVQLERTLAAEDAGAVASIAHRLKGASANAAAPLLQARAAQIEQFAGEKRLSEARDCVDELRQEWCWFKESVSSVD
jgi:HPt (histidine-containing phosphotransfer) domain-containing protein